MAHHVRETHEADDLYVLVKNWGETRQQLDPKNYSTTE